VYFDEVVERARQSGEPGLEAIARLSQGREIIPRDVSTGKRGLFRVFYGGIAGVRLRNSRKKVV
jgi:hypothetical protein